MITNRELGGTLAFSIGTAIPLELNVLVERPVVKELWFNLKTLFRNFHHSIPRETVLDRKIVTELFIEEVENIVAFCREQGIITQLYTTKSPASFERLFWTAKLKSPKTSLQRQYADFERIVLSVAKHQFKDTLLNFNIALNGPIDRPVHVITSYPVDLLSQYKFGRFTLLDSHTGNVKDPSTWITKLTDDPLRRHLPFNILTLVVLGDKATDFFSLKTGNRRDLLEMANKCKWNPTTSMPKVRADCARFAGDSTDLFLHILKINLP